MVINFQSAELDFPHDNTSLILECLYVFPVPKERPCFVLPNKAEWFLVQSQIVPNATVLCPTIGMDVHTVSTLPYMLRHFEL